MTAKTAKENLNPVIAKSLLTSIKTNIDDVFYASVAFPIRATYLTYAGTVDSESEYFGGTVATDFDPTDASFYSQNTISLHKIYPGGATRVIKRTDWVLNGVYNAWPATDCHVLVKQYINGASSINVYRCLFSPQTESTVVPSDLSAAPSQLPDGYVWKYLYTISSSDAIKFLTEDWMPVPEKISSTEAQSLVVGTAKYNQYVIQENTELGTIYGVTVDSDAAVTDIGLGGSVAFYASDESGNTPTQQFAATVGYSAADKRFQTTLTSVGKGYVGPIKLKRTSNNAVLTSVTANIVPGLGHGSDIATEAFASSVMMVARNVPDGDILKVIAENEANMINLVSNPVDNLTKKICTQDFYVACKSFGANAPTFSSGDILTSGSKTAVVVNVDGNRVYYVNNVDENDTFAVSDTVTSGSKTSFVTVVYDREVIFNSGNILISDWKVEAFSRSSDQIESLNFIIQIQ